MTPSEFCEDVGAGKTRMIWLPYGEKTDNMLSRFHLIPEHYGQMDEQICYINIARQYAVNHSQTSKNPFAGQLNNLTAVREFLSAVE